MEKRSFLKVLVAAMGGTVAAVAAIPALVTALSPALQRNKQPAWRAIGPLDSFQVDTIRKATVQLQREDWASSLRKKGVYVSRPSEEEIVVFSMNCTDLSCPVNWDPGSGFFYCPCHGGIFRSDGERMAGPPKRPLYRYATRIRDGVVEIDLNSVPPIA